MSQHSRSACIIAILSLSMFASAQKMAPINPSLARIESRVATGLMPSAVMLPPYKPNMHTLAVYPSSYDLRTLGKSSPVRDQGYAGTCWAFASYGSMEGCMRPSDTTDLSEMNMANRHGFDVPKDWGGNRDMATAFLARWDGPVMESDDPYLDTRQVSPNTFPQYGHMQDAIWLPPRSSSTDNDIVKHCILTYGPVAGDFFYNPDNYTSSTSSIYSDAVNEGNHAVTFVGWDDNYSRTNFKAASGMPPGDGAFLFRNSWSDDWGQAGYAWISYYDRNLLQWAWCYPPLQPEANYRHIYQYDRLGWTRNFGYDSDTAYAAAIFPAVATEQIESVAFYTPVVNTKYQIKLYLDPADTPLTGEEYGVTTGLIDLPGYHTVVLSSPVPVIKGQKFSVVVKLVTPDYKFPIPFEDYVVDYSVNINANPGETYTSADGMTWRDVTIDAPKASVCLKAFGKPAGLTRTISGQIDLGENLGYLPYVNLQAQIRRTDVSGDTVSTPLLRHLNGEYRIDWVPAGTVSMRVSGCHYCAATATGLGTKTGDVVTGFSLINGDADGDNQVNLFDLMVLDSHFGKSDGMADLNGDGMVNLFDYVVIDQNFGSQGSLSL